jgi:putative endonuclease
MYKTFGTYNYYVYTLTNKNKTVLYIGVTNDLKERLYAHRNPDVLSKAFTAKYKWHYLIYWEHYRDINTAIDREKQLKGWTRNKKDELIAQFNPTLRFLNDEIED